MNNGFYMVYLEGGQGPTYQHPNRESATKEAKRLAKQIGRKAYVLCSIESVELNEFKHEKLVPQDIDPDLPF
ncbi:hypothetical protein GCM10027189_38980 [Rufibacter soli]